MSTNPPRRKAPTRPMTAPLPKKGTTGALKKGKAKGKKKKKRGMTLGAQLVGGLTLLAVVGGAAALAVYLAEQSLPKEAGPPRAPDAVVRPSIAPTLSGVVPQRPGWAASPEDEVYAPRASDVAGAPIEPPVQGLLAREVLTVFADGQFRPNWPVSRAEFVNWCYNAVMAQSVPGPDPFVSPKQPLPKAEAHDAVYADVPAEHWAANVLASLVQAGVLGAKPGAHFRPDSPLSREEWAMMASLFASSKESRRALAEPLDEKKLQVAYRLRHYTDFEALKPGYKPYVAFVFTDDTRARWLGEAFTPPAAPAPWEPQRPVTRGEAAAWIGGVYEQVGNGIF